MGFISTGSRTLAALAVAFAVSSCSSVGGIDTAAVSPISNDLTYATLGYLWGGARTAIQNKREPLTSTFTLPLTYQLPCTRGGQGSYQGTLAGSKSGGSGSATLTLTATLSACQFDDKVKITTISASGVTISGTIAVTNDTWGAMNVRMVAPTVSVNGTTCPGGVDVTLSGTSPSAQPISTGTACGRTGAVPLP